MSREKVLSLLLEQGDRYVSGEAMSRAWGSAGPPFGKPSRPCARRLCDPIRPQPGLPPGERPGPGAGGGALRPAGRLPGGGHLLCLETIDSTNTEAKRQAMAGPPTAWSSSARNRPGAGAAGAVPSSPPRGRASTSPPCCAPSWTPARWPTSPPGWRWRCATTPTSSSAGASRGSFRDCTRVAALDVPLWTQLFSMNAPALTKVIRTWRTTCGPTGWCWSGETPPPSPRSWPGPPTGSGA